MLQQVHNHWHSFSEHIAAVAADAIKPKHPDRHFAYFCNTRATDCNGGFSNDSCHRILRSEHIWPQKGLLHETVWTPCNELDLALRWL